MSLEEATQAEAGGQRDGAHIDYADDKHQDGDEYDDLAVRQRLESTGNTEHEEYNGEDYRYKVIGVAIGIVLLTLLQVLLRLCQLGIGIGKVGFYEAFHLEG